MAAKLCMVETHGQIFWKTCKMPGGCCSKFKGHNYKICELCGYSDNQKATTDEINEYLIGEELSKIIMAGANEGVKHWLFCSHYRDTLYIWGGCASVGGCCTDVYWSRDQNECIGCEEQRTAILDHKGFEVGLDNNGQIIIKKERTEHPNIKDWVK